MTDHLSHAQSLLSDSDFVQDFAAARELGRDIAIATVAMHTRARGFPYPDNRRIADHLLGSQLSAHGVGVSTQSPATETANVPKEPPVFFTTQTLLNGTDIAKMSDDQIYAAISAKKAQIDNLEKIEPKPARLAKQITDAKADLAALVAYLDKLDAKDASAAA